MQGSREKLATILVVTGTIRRGKHPKVYSIMVGIPDSQKKTTAFKLPRTSFNTSTNKHTKIARRPPQLFCMRRWAKKIVTGVQLKSYFTNLDNKLQILNHFWRSQSVSFLATSSRTGGKVVFSPPNAWKNMWQCQLGSFASTKIREKESQSCAEFFPFAREQFTNFSALPRVVQGSFQWFEGITFKAGG